MEINLTDVSVAVLGGDLRELELAKTLLNYNIDLRLVGFPRCPELENAKYFFDAFEAVKGAEFVMAPMANTDMEGRIFLRLDNEEPIDLKKLIPVFSANTVLFIGVAKPIITELADKYQIRIVETAEIDEIAILNSIPTAEGAIQLAMEELPITLHGSKCLIVGFGRCGMTLARNLKSLGAKVSIATRRKSQLARAIEMGLIPLPLKELINHTEFDVIFNFAPALILTRSYLERLRKSTLIIDLAAAPGGVDYDAAELLGIKSILALSLPGKVAPVTAGKILSDCIPRLLQEIIGGDENAI